MSAISGCLYMDSLLVDLRDTVLSQNVFPLEGSTEVSGHLSDGVI
jgi:hypothetical protein